MNSVRLCIFGSPRLRCPDQSDIRLPTGQVSVLLLRLALAGEAGCTRADLCESLWPDEDPATARPRLRQALVQLKAALDAAGIASQDVIRADRTSIALDTTALPHDIAAFESAVRRGDWEAADALYTGPFAPNCDDPEIVRERDRLLVAHRNVLHALADAHARAGNLLHAIHGTERLLTDDPLDETAVLRLSTLYLLAGRSHEARNRYRKLQRDYRLAFARPLPERTRAEFRAAFDAHRRQDSKRLATELVGGRPALTHVPTSRLPPMPRTRFFGRTEQLSSLEALLRDPRCRLITLTGPAGSGKSRLALEAASRRLERNPCFVPVADISDGRQMIEKIVSSLRLPFDAKIPPLTQALAALTSEASPLLVLDNLEHLLEQAATIETITALLNGAPRLTLLATSRQPTLMPGERDVAVAPLPTPPADVAEDPRMVASFDGSALLIDRLTLHQPAFRLTRRNAVPLTALCRALDGLPLALEIIATWARTLTLHEMLAQLSLADRRGKVLSAQRGTGSATTDMRHASLQAAIDWSYGLLAPDLQRFFRALHVFRGGWTEESAAIVCDESRAPEFLTQLVDRSLILRLEGEGTARFGILESLREYGQEKSDAAERAALVRRHGDYYLTFARLAAPELLRADQGAWSTRLRVEGDNFRAALDGALSTSGDVFLGLRLAGTLWRFWTNFAHFDEGRGYLNQLIERIPPTDEAIPGRAEALFALGNVSFYLGDVAEGIARAQECLAVPHLPEDASVVALNQAWLGVMLFFCSQLDAARENTLRGLARARVAGDEWVSGYALAQAGLQAFFAEDTDQAFAFCEESLGITARLKEQWLVGLNCFVLALCEQRVNAACELADDYFDRCLRAWEPLNDVWCLAFCRTMFAFVLQRTNRPEDALLRHHEALTRFVEIDEKQGIATAIGGLGESASAACDHVRAATLWGASDAMYERIGIPLWPFLREYRESAVSSTRAFLGDDSFDSAYSDGHSLEANAAISFALSSE